uniref:AB hydrolase-1 domain-containing protein n=1 Tax=Anopheles dirus TaxID=7168 RepID=A0A182NS69_9DIPT
MEHHEVTTTDGYVLTLTRILPMAQRANGTLPVLLVPGLMGTSAGFLLAGPNNGLAYVLADRGYDVWLANLRGNRYSRRHTSLSVNSEAYWDFSMHEAGYYDLPAMIDRILLVTGVRRLGFVGYSQGATVFFIMAASRPEYNEKIARMYALCPAVYLDRVRSPVVRWLSEHVDLIKDILDALGWWQALPYSRVRNVVFSALCPVRERRNFCIRLLEQFGGPNPEGTDLLAQYILGGHTPSGTSTKQIQHILQLIRYDRFQQFAYARKEQNLAHYGAEQPPAYNLSVATAPVAIFYGMNDWVVHPTNIARLAAELPNLVSVTLLEDRNFNHNDFLFAKRVRALLYDKLLIDLDQL